MALVDGGGFFPEDDLHQPASWFMMDAMKMIGTDAVGIGDRDLRFGLAYLRAQVKRSGLPMVCANLHDKSGKSVVAPSLIKKIGSATVGFYGLISDKVDLGPARDSLVVEEPSAAAKRTIADLKKRGATVIVLLSQLGKVESEDLASAVDGNDVVIAGRNVPLLQTGRNVKNSVVVYGGEQGQYMGRTVVALDAKRHMASGTNEMYLLGPEVGENKDVAEIVKKFEDNLNEQMRKKEKEIAAQQAASDSTRNTPDHFLGTEVCARCHAAEATQWKTTKHAQAWQTLVDKHKDANPECIGCHVVGYNQPGGFTNSGATPALSNVQCENCHGMGTHHEAFATKTAAVTEATCIQCHNATTSPEFNFDRFKPYIDHKHMTADLPVLTVKQPMKDIK